MAVQTSTTQPNRGGSQGGNFFGRVGNFLTRPFQNFRQHPIQTIVQTGLGMVNPALGVAARVGFNQYNNRGPSAPDPTRMDVPNSNTYQSPGPFRVDPSQFAPNLGGPRPPSNFGFSYANPQTPSIGPALPQYNNPSPDANQMSANWQQLMSGVNRGAPAPTRSRSQMGGAMSAGSRTWLTGRAAQDWVDSNQQGGMFNNAEALQRLYHRERNA